MSYHYDAVVLPDSPLESLPQLQDRIVKYFPNEKIVFTRDEPEHSESSEIFKISQYKDHTVIKVPRTLLNFLKYLSINEGKLPNNKTYAVPNKVYAFSSYESVGYQLFLEFKNRAIISAFEIKEEANAYNLDLADLFQKYLTQIESGLARNPEMLKPEVVSKYKSNLLQYSYEFAYNMLFFDKLGYSEDTLLGILEGKVYDENDKEIPLETYYFQISSAHYLQELDPMIRHVDTVFSRLELPTVNSKNQTEKTEAPPKQSSTNDKPVPAALALTVGIIGFALIGLFIWFVLNSLYKLVISPNSLTYWDWGFLALAVIILLRKIAKPKSR